VRVSLAALASVAVLATAGSGAAAPEPAADRPELVPSAAAAAKIPKRKKCGPRCARLFVSPGGTNGNRWTHLAGTYDGGVLRLFVDGAEVSSLAAGGTMPASGGPLRIGGNDVWGEWFRGTIDEIRVYNRALSADEVRADMATAVAGAAARPGLVAAYSFDTGGQTIDASGHGHNGVVKGATWTSSGRFGGAFAFDGVDDWISVPDADLLDLTNAGTFEAWVRPAELGEWRTVLIKEQPNQLVYALYANTGAPGQADVPSAHVYLGDDISTRGGSQLPLNSCTDRREPCATFEHVYRAAQPGDVIDVAGGSFPYQALHRDDAKAGGAHVVFRAAHRATPRVAGLDVYANHVTFEGLTIDGDWSTHAETDDVTFRDVTVNGAVFIDSSANIRVLGGSVGGTVDSKSQFSSWPPGTRIRNIVIDGVTFHDVTRSNAGVHVECLLIGGGENVIIRNSRFERCSVFDLSIAEFNGSGPPRNFTIENNFFGASDGFYSLHFNTNTTALHDIVVRNNSSPQAFYHGNDIPLLVGVRYVANVAPLGALHCDSRITYRHNIWDGGVCDATDVDAPSGFVDAAAGDLHLQPGAAAIGRGDPADYPATDIDGHRRPRGSAVDAGADERG
jgi:hypothetical protein